MGRRYDERRCLPIDERVMFGWSAAITWTCSAFVLSLVGRSIVETSLAVC
jgi:hypothetical protein